MVIKRFEEEKLKKEMLQFDKNELAEMLVTEKNNKLMYQGLFWILFVALIIFAIFFINQDNKLVSCSVQLNNAINLLIQNNITGN